MRNSWDSKDRGDLSLQSSQAESSVTGGRPRIPPKNRSPKLGSKSSFCADRYQTIEHSLRGQIHRDRLLTSVAHICPGYLSLKRHFVTIWYLCLVNDWIDFAFGEAWYTARSLLDRTTRCKCVMTTKSRLAEYVVLPLPSTC